MVTINSFICGIFFSSFLALIVVFHKNYDKPVYLFRALLAFFSALYLYLSTSLHFPGFQLAINVNLKFFALVYVLQALSLAWSVYFFINERRFLKATLAITVFLVLFGILNHFYPNSIVYASTLVWDSIELSKNENYHFISSYNEHWTYLGPLFFSALITYYIYILFSVRRTVSPGKFFLFLILVLIFICFNVYDVLVDLQIIHFIYLTEYAMLPIVILLSMYMADEIQEKYYSQQALRDEKIKFLQLIDNVKLLVVQRSSSGTIEYANPFFFKFTGYDWNDLNPSSEQQIEVDLDLPIPSETLVHGEELDDTVESIITTKEGERKSIVWSNVQLLGEADIGVISVGTDVTERNQQSEQLKKTLLELKSIKKILVEENTFLKQHIVLQVGDEKSILGQSKQIQKIRQEINRLKNTDVTVLIEGETGTGKDIIAYNIFATGKRKDAPFIIVNCGALPRDLIESELFGHEKGAFTGASGSRRGRFELAHGGTLFLDEIGELPIELQPKLLRVIQTGEFEKLGGESTQKVDVRIIAATNVDLKEAIKRGTFREDLYYRLSVFPIEVPPLRNRLEDIQTLVEHFAGLYARKYERHDYKIPISLINMFTSYAWPGNIRELKNLVERAVLTSKDGVLKLPFDLLAKDASTLTTSNSLEEVERRHIMTILEKCNWKIRGEDGAASALKLKESTLRFRMKKLGITRPNHA